MNALASYTDKQLELIRNTVAKGTTPDEFNWFMEIARSTRLNPLRRQIYCFLFHERDPKKRQMVVVTGIDGYRSIAARSGNYRPGKAITCFDEAMVNPDTNPLGISHSEVTVYLHSHGEWHEITERADWSEYAPIIDIWAEDETGQRRKTGRQQLEPKKDGWRRMGRIMLEKCAEARALRRGWPDDLGATYTDTEVDQAQVLDLPSERIEAAEQAKRYERIGGPAITVDWMDGGELQRVPVGKFGDAALSFIREHTKPGEEEIGTVLAWRDRNSHALKEYWAHDKDGALQIKAALEQLTQAVAAE